MHNSLVKIWLIIATLVIIFIGVAVIGFKAHPQQLWNNPHLLNGAENVGYLPFASAPKTLDPARSYTAEENRFIAQIYEPPLQYHYLKRPYTLVPLSGESMPLISYYTAKGQRLSPPVNHQQIAYTVYDIFIKPGIKYQPHPAFAMDGKGRYHYHYLTNADLTHIHVLADFKYTGTRELTAEDFVYEIKRLADPTVQSPILGLMSEHIVGLAELAKQLQSLTNGINLSQEEIPYIDLRRHEMAGVKVISRYHYQIKIQGDYPQFKYWLAMPFFSPIPWEVIYFYSQPGMMQRNITLDWYPVGTGPYLLAENNPNRQIILARNPYFHGEFYPNEGEPGDQAKGYLLQSGKSLPFIDKFIFTLDKESIPRWDKFLQGYYDQSGVSADSFDQAIHIDSQGKVHLTPALLNKGIYLDTAVESADYYLGFNMLDSVVGGYGEAQRKLRRAIAIAFNEEEFIAIFLNGRGISAQGPIPPGIFGYLPGKLGINPWIYNWHNNEIVRKPLSEAQQLLAQAGYPNGIDPKTGQALIINYDIMTSGGPDENAQFNWMRKQFAKLNIQLNIRATLYNRFQDKMRSGDVQFFGWAWLADYPDPENFLFLLYGPNGKVYFDGENAANYANAKVDSLFTQIAYLADSPLRQQKIDELVDIVRRDGPWIWGFFPINFTLNQTWIYPNKPNPMANNTLKYLRLNSENRAKLRLEWNRPIIWPLLILLGCIVLLWVPLILAYWHREQQPSARRF